MRNKGTYHSRIGDIIIVSDGGFLTGVYFQNQKYSQKALSGEFMETDDEIIKLTREWLDEYFAGKVPDVEIPVKLEGTDFQKKIWRLLSNIKYGETTTYGDLAKTIAEEQGIERMSAQAVGNAVGHNPVSIIVPCHRVVAANGSLAGYAAGIEKKRFLLEMEKKK